MKREKKWTQGEWWRSGLEIVVMPMQVKICNMVGGSNRVEAKANAQLITAAPELIEDCEWMLDAVEFLRDHTNGKIKYDCDKRLEKIKSTIAKAYGEVTHK